jgi:DNA invertase Pin-like site-specific DNA recombinase
MLIGYVRASKSDGTQTPAPQRDAMLAAGVDPARIYHLSGRRDDRPGLTACLKAIQLGNTLVLWKLDRLGRDLRHRVNTVEDLRTRGIGLKVLTGAGARIPTRSSLNALTPPLDRIPSSDRRRTPNRISRQIAMAPRHGATAV